MADTYLKAVESLNYADPVPVLLGYRKIERAVAASDLPENVKNLRTAELKGAREAREAALFALGVGQLIGTKVFVAPVEDADYDFVIKWYSDEQISYAPVQLKELVSEKRNPETSIQGLLAKLRQRPHTNTLLLIRLNRREEVRLDELNIEELAFKEVWFLWQSSSDSSRWSILGDAKTTPRQYDFAYPTTT